MFDPALKIDEIKLRINHYYKMQETIMSLPGYLVLVSGLSRIALAAKISFPAIHATKISEKVLLSLVSIDLIFIIHILVMMLLFASVRIVNQIA